MPDFTDDVDLAVWITITITHGNFSAQAHAIACTGATPVFDYWKLSNEFPL